MRAHWLALSLALAALAAGGSTLGENPRLRLSQAPVGSPGDGPLLRPLVPSSLAFRLTMEFECPADARPGRVFVSIADTSAEADAAQSPLEIDLRVPAAQLAGVQEAARCETSAPKLLRAQLSAFASLRCEAEDGQRSFATVSQPLDLWLDCEGLPGPGSRPDETSLLDD